MVRLVTVLLGICAASLMGALVGGSLLPDAGQVSFDAYRDGDWDIYLLDVARGFIHNLTAAHHQGWDRDTAWSPDGRWLAYTSVVGLDNADIFLREVQCPSLFQSCARPRNLTRHAGNDYAPVWSPDGAKLAFVSERDYNREVYLLDETCFTTTDCSQGVHNISQHPDSDITPIWSPDGSQIAFVSERGGSQGLYITPIRERNIRALVTGFSRGLLWSPDGAYMAFVSGGDIFLAANDCQAMKNGCNAVMKNLTDSRYTDWLQTWSPDSRQIMFQSNRTAEPQVYITDITCAGESAGCASNARLLTPDLEFQLMAAWSPDGSDVVVLSNDTRHMELYRVRLNTGALHRLTYLNTQLYAPHWRPMG